MLTLLFASVTCAQTSNGSTPPTDKAALISLCGKAKDEVIASRALIESYEDTLKKQEREQSLSDAEIVKLRQALDYEKAALAQSELAVSTYKKALAKEVKKKRFYKTLTKGLIVVAGVAVGVAIMR